MPISWIQTIQAQVGFVGSFTSMCLAILSSAKVLEQKLHSTRTSLRGGGFVSMWDRRRSELGTSSFLLPPLPIVSCTMALKEAHFRLIDLWKQLLHCKHSSSIKKENFFIESTRSTVLCVIQIRNIFYYCWRLSFKPLYEPILKQQLHLVS